MKAVFALELFARSRRGPGDYGQNATFEESAWIIRNRSIALRVPSLFYNLLSRTAGR
jgi:hypothetical protein